MSRLLFALVDFRFALWVRLARIRRGEWGESSQPWATPLMRLYGDEMRNSTATLGWWRSTWVGA